MRRVPLFFLASTLCASLALAFVACSEPAPVSTLPVTDDDEDTGTKRRDSGRTDEIPDGADPFTLCAAAMCLPARI